MLVRYVTPTGRMGRVLADHLLRVLGIDEDNNVTVRVGTMLITVSASEIEVLCNKVHGNRVISLEHIRQSRG